MNKQHQAILARDMIDMMRNFSDNADVLEYLDSFAFSIARMFENKEKIVDWDVIAGICDQRYHSLKSGEPVALDKSLLDECERRIQPYLT